MPLRFNPVSLLSRLRSTYWFLPSVVTAAAAGLAAALIEIDRVSAGTGWLTWAYAGGPAGARALLSAVAGSIITVVSVTFSVLVVALTVSSQHFGPRLLSNFMRDTPAQLVLGSFTGTFAYCLVVLRTVQGDGGDRGVLFVPHLAVTGAVALTLVGVGMLIYYVHHVARNMQVSEITAAVAGDLERTIERLYPDPIGRGIPPTGERAPDAPPGSAALPAHRSGYIQEIDGDRVVRLAAARRATIWLLRRPGDFVIEGTAVAAISPVPDDLDGFGRKLWQTYVVGADRTSRQDAAFAIQQLVEVALRALSPGVNEAFTAMTCVDRLGQGLAKLFSRQIPSAIRTDGEGQARVVAPPRTSAELVGGAFEPIALAAERDPAVAAKLLDTLAELAAMARRAEDLDALARTAALVDSLAAAQPRSPHHRAQLMTTYQRTQRAIEQARDTTLRSRLATQNFC